jgi:hypothetical protein
MDSLWISEERTNIVKPPASTDQIAFRYQTTDSATGVTRDTAKRLAELLGVDETQAIHRALHDLAAKLLPQYEADDGPLTDEQMREIKNAVPQGIKREVRSSLFEIETP